MTAQAYVPLTFDSGGASLRLRQAYAYDNNKYSVIASAVGRLVEVREVRAYAERIELRQDGRVVGDDTRSFRFAGGPRSGCCFDNSSRYLNLWTGSGKAGRAFELNGVYSSLRATSFKGMKGDAVGAAASLLKCMPAYWRLKICVKKTLTRLTNTLAV